MTKKVKGFSLLEIIIVILVIAILASLAMVKFDTTTNKTSMLKVKTDIANIQSSLAAFHNQALANDALILYPDALDSCAPNTKECALFVGSPDTKLLKQPIYSCDTNNIQSMCWVKNSQNNYTVFLNPTSFVEFTYSSLDGSFTCDAENINCVEITQ